MTVYWSYSKWYISIVRDIVSPVDHSVVKVWILAQPYKSTLSFVEIFSGLYAAIYDILFQSSNYIISSNHYNDNNFFAYNYIYQKLFS